MSKLPMETRPIRLAPDIARCVEALLRPLSGKKLERAQAAVLRVYQSGKQGSHGDWLAWYTQEIENANERESVAA